MPALTRITPNDGASTVTAIDACPRGNASDDDAAPRPPAGFRTNADKKGWRH